MSVKHFKLGWRRCHLIECTSALTIEQSEEDCGWVHWREHKDEIARLKAERERIEPELEQRCRELNLSLAQQAVQLRQIEDLKAEVERLRKAGDAMHRAIKVSDPFLDWAIECWLAAKEGKQGV